MDATLKLWVVIAVVGVSNYLSRLSFIAVFSRRSMPAWLTRALRYVPAAMLTALIVPMILGTPDAGVVGNPRVAAAIVAGVVAFLTRSTLGTLAAGMAMLWMLQAGPGAFG